MARCSEFPTLAVQCINVGCIKGYVKSLLEANKLLKFAKENSDVGLRYRHIGEVQDLHMVAMVDARSHLEVTGRRKEDTSSCW